jgi:hypothetical protein
MWSFDKFVCIGPVDPGRLGDRLTINISPELPDISPKSIYRCFGDAIRLTDLKTRETSNSSPTSIPVSGYLDHMFNHM